PRRPPGPTLFPYTTLFRSGQPIEEGRYAGCIFGAVVVTSDCLAFFVQPQAVRIDEIQYRLAGSQILHEEGADIAHHRTAGRERRSEEHTSELQSRENLVCR